MSELVWDQLSEKLYETGVEKGVLYPQESGSYPLGVAWNGLINVEESADGAEPNDIYADNAVYLKLMSVEKFKAKLEAYTFPKEFNECDGVKEAADGVFIGQQTRKAFGLCYKTLLGNDVDGNDYGYKLHLVYGALASPSTKAFNTVNDTPEAITFSWDMTTTPVEVTGEKPTASIVINSKTTDPAKLAALETILYGDVGVDPYLPMPDAVIALMENAAPSAIAVSSIVPADGASGVLINANVVITFNNEINTAIVVLTKNDGTIVSAAQSWDTAGKVLTINPTGDLDNSGVYIVTIGATDIYNQVLAPVVKNFEVVGA